MSHNGVDRPQGAQIADAKWAELELTRTVEVFYTVQVTRDEAIEYLVDAGADEQELLAMSGDDLIDAMISPDSEFSDEVGMRLDDVSVETDSGSRPWEVIR